MVVSVKATNQIVINPKVYFIGRDNIMEIYTKIETKETYYRQ